MKRYLLTVLCVLLITGCAHPTQQHLEREIAPRKAGANYRFKTWPGSTTSYMLCLQGVKATSATLGPDFSVHYFTFEPQASLALYNGGHPKKSDEKADSRFEARFGSKRAEWRLIRRDTDCRAEAYIPDGDGSFWHVIIIAPTEQRVREVVDQMDSFRQQGKSAADKAPN